MSVCLAMSPALATIFSFEKSRKWIIRDGVTGISRSGSGAPIASGWKKSLGFLKALLASFSIWGRRNLSARASRRLARLPPPASVNCGVMEGDERDDTQDWLLPEGAAPPLLSELEARIDEALIVAKASEKAVMAVGDAALDAAEQARRAADLAERATAAALQAVSAPGASASGELPAQSDYPPEDEALRSFSERADRVVARLQALERLAVPAQG